MNKAVEKFQKILKHGEEYCQKHDFIKIPAGFDSVPMGQSTKNVFICPECRDERAAFFEEEAKKLPDICEEDD